MLVAALLATTAVGVFGLSQRVSAKDQAQQSRARELAGQAELAMTDDPERAVMLSLAAMRTTSTPVAEAVSALQAATQADRAVVTVAGVGQQAFAASPDGSMVAVDRADGPGFVLVDPRDGKVADTVTTTRPAAFQSLGFAPTGTAVAIGYASTTRRHRPQPAASSRSPSSSPCPAVSRWARSPVRPGRTRRSPTTPPAAGSARRATPATGTRSWCGT